MKLCAALRGLALLLLLAVAAGVGAAELPSFEQVRDAHRPSDLQLLDRHGEPLQTLRLDPKQRRLRWVALDGFSPALLHALLLSEDRRFYEHSGIDWSAVAASAWGNLWNQRTRGASTLTMQLAGLIDADSARPQAGRSAWQKLGQAWVAQQLEARWSKAQILEAYLNEVPLRGELIGVPAAAQLLFERGPAALDAEESALLAVLVRAPNAPARTVAQRACALLQQLGRRARAQGCDALVWRAESAFARRPGALPERNWAPHYARLVLRREGAAQQRSSLDAGVQRLAVQVLRQQLLELRGRQVEDGAVLVLDNASGEVLAWVGSSGGEISSAAEVDGVQARRQPGSTLKPFVYQYALERRLITAASLLDDSAAQISTGAGLYLPQNYDRRHHGWVSTRAALGNSLNIPAVRVAQMLAPQALAQRLQAWGLRLAHDGDYYGEALALGGAEVSLLELSNAYRALANGGRLTPVRLPGSGASAPRPAADAASSFIVADILADPNARAQTFGLDSVLALPFWAAVKTGTSKDMRDNWCLGFSDRYTVGVWVGNASGAPMHEVSGVSGAAPVWARLMQYLHRGQAGRAPVAPAGLLRQTVLFDAAVGEPSRPEWFLPGTELARVQLATRQAQGISNPRDGAIYALDPDMPPRAQRIVFEGEPGQWRLDGRLLGRGARCSWMPQPGRHRLQLLDAQGRLLHGIEFEVRGAWLKPAARTADKT